MSNVPNHLRKFHFAEDGRPLTKEERTALYSQITFDQTRGDASTLPGTVAERQEFRKAQTNTDLAVRQRVAEKAAEGRAPLNVFRQRQHELEAKGAPPSHIEPHRLAADKLDRQRAEQARQVEYQANESVRLMLEHAEATERSHKQIWPNASLDEVGYILATARSTEFDDPALHAAAYWQAVRDTETVMYAREDAALKERQEAAAAVTVDAAEQAKRVEAAKARLDFAEQQLGGGDAQ